jgi:hypothetical protein
MLYLLKMIAKPDYGDTAAFVVRASAAEAARKHVYDELVEAGLIRVVDFNTRIKGRPPHLLETERAGVYTQNVMWLCPDQSTCTEIPQDGPAEIILIDHRDG